MSDLPPEEQARHVRARQLTPLVDADDKADENLRTHDFHERHALAGIDVRGWTYVGVCVCGHRGPRIDGWPEHHHDLLDEHLWEALGDE